MDPRRQSPGPPQDHGYQLEDAHAHNPYGQQPGFPSQGRLDIPMGPGGGGQRVGTPSDRLHPQPTVSYLENLIKTILTSSSTL